jgi:tungstate transport system substrate-binding protein
LILELIDRDMMEKKLTGSLVVMLLFAVLIIGVMGCGGSAVSPLPSQERLRVATTTSLYDTGLWEYLEPIFEEQYNVELDVMEAGTGIALEYGRRGDVDVIVVHAKDREERFVAEGYGVERVPFAYNYFLIIGPEADPAGIKGMSSEGAFQKLMETGGGSFISRGDDSGTHGKEKTIWQSAGFDYETVRQAGEWYIEAGRGMGPTLLMASEKQAYTLTDMGTFLSYMGELELVPIVDEGDILLNVYSVIAVSPESNPKTEIDLANELIAFITSPEIQELIGNYGVEEYGMQLFMPCAGNEPSS